MNELIKLLRKRDLLGKNGPKISAIASLSSTKMIDLFEEVREIATANDHPTKHSVFSFSASLGLGGSSLECQSLDCRLDRINALARFALLYGDEVYISNFLTDYDIESIVTEEDIQFTKENLYADLLILQEIRPLIEQGYIKFFEPQRNVCFSCHADKFLGKNAHKRFDEEYKRLKNNFLANLHVECEKEDDLYLFRCDGPSPYFDHARIHTSSQLPKELAAKPNVLKRVQRGEIIHLSKTLTKSLGLHVELAHLVATNAVHGLATSGFLKTSFLTENDLHISFLNSLHYDPEIRERNSIALKHLESMVPFVEDVALKEIIKLRQREEEAFIAYRQALNLAIDNFTQSGGIFTEKDARTLHADVIAPSLALLDRKVKHANGIW
jgi:hypothetical protein